MLDSEQAPARHYPTPAARCADLVVHLTGLAFALVGGAVLLGLSVGMGTLTQTAAIAVYAAALLLMLAFSTAYNFSKAPHRPLLHRLDHAGIFLMIAGSYTPFTTQNLHGAWAVAMTTAVWSIAGLGILGKLCLSRLSDRFWVGVYLALGWLVLVALKPMVEGVPWVALALLALGGLLYTSGVVFHVNKRLRYARAIWHGHVVAAAGAHWAAVLIGVVLAQG